MYTNQRYQIQIIPKSTDDDGVASIELPLSISANEKRARREQRREEIREEKREGERERERQTERDEKREAVVSQTLRGWQTALRQGFLEGKSQV